MKILDVYVPISDERLDYIFIESKTLEKGPPIKPNQEVFFGYILLIPNSPGLIL